MDIKGHVVEARVGRARLRHRRGVLRELHARPRGQEAPRHAVGQGGVEIERSPSEDPDAIVKICTSTRSTGSPRRRRAGRGRGAKLNPAADRRRGRHPAEALPLLRRGRLRPRRDQPADPHARRRGARPRRQGHASTTTPRSATPSGTSTRPPRSSTSASSWPTRRACSTSASTATVGIIANGAGLAMSTLDVVNQVGGTAGQLPRHRRRRQRRRDGRRARGHQLRRERAGRSSSTSSAASPRARRSPTASSRRSAGSTCGRRS